MSNISEKVEKKLKKAVYNDFKMIYSMSNKII
jgi:hypothetical protein